MKKEVGLTNIEEINIEEIMDIPKEYNYISKPKLIITDEIKKALDEKNMSIRQLAENIGMKHPQIHRVTGLKNYNIDTLLNILNGLDLELVVRKIKK